MTTVLVRPAASGPRSDPADRPPAGSGTGIGSGRRSSPVRSKVPEVTTVFWMAKVLSTGMGETTSDFLVHRFGPYVAVALGAAGLAVAMGLQARARRYVAGIYWLAVVMVSIFGTMAADILHVGFGVPYVVSTALYAAVLAGAFVAWQRSEKTLSIHSITTARRELFYWTTVCATFALGPATGDLSARTVNLGYLTSGPLFGAVMLVPAIGYRYFRLNGMLAFWFAYVVTRPLGASFADWVGVSHSRGGLASVPASSASSSPGRSPCSWPTWP